MFDTLRLRLSKWLSPDLAQRAAILDAHERAVWANQMHSNRQHEALRAKGIKGTVLDYQIWVGWHRNAIHFKNQKAMKTLLLPKPAETNDRP